MYDTSLKRKWDNQNALNYARKEAIKEHAIEMAIAMKKDGLSVEAICKYTGLSKEEVEKL